MKLRGRIIQFCLKFQHKKNEILIERGQCNSLNNMKQNFIGKIAELYLNNKLCLNQQDDILTIFDDDRDRKFTADLTLPFNKTISVKARAKSNYDCDRFTFGKNDPLKEDYFVGIFVNYQENNDIYIGNDDNEEFIIWAKGLTNIQPEILFICNRQELNNPAIWDKSIYDTKRVLVASRIQNKLNLEDLK